MLEERFDTLQTACGSTDPDHSRLERFYVRMVGRGRFRRFARPIARERGLRYVGVYAREDTSSPIVAKQGFEKVGQMIAWHRPAA